MLLLLFVLSTAVHAGGSTTSSIARRLQAGEANPVRDDDEILSEQEPTYGEEADEATSEVFELWEGDMQLTPAQLQRVREFPSDDSEPSIKRRAATTDTAELWPKEHGKVIMPYLIDSDMSSEKREHIDWAIQRLSEETCVRLVPWSYRPIYATFKNHGCSSPVGMQTSKAHEIKVGECSKGSVLHEILHSLGVFHEQSRSDRDEYVTINWGNIKPDKTHNFEHCEDCHHQDLPYDYSSIMHYREGAFQIKDSPTIVTRNGADIGQRDDMTDLDAAAVNILYDCDEAYQPGLRGATPAYPMVNAIGETCETSGYAKFDAEEECFAAAVAMGLEPKESTTNWPRPVGCYRKDSEVYFGYNPISGGAQETRIPICRTAQPEYPWIYEDGATCESSGFRLLSESECLTAGQAQGLREGSPFVNSDKNRPEGCYRREYKVYYGLPSVNAGNGAQSANGRHPICSSTEPSEPSEPPACPSVTVTFTHGNDMYFNFDKDAWLKMTGESEVSGYWTVKQTGSKHNWEGKVVVWDNHNGVHGRRVSGASENQWSKGDEISIECIQ